jgi:hypothetical protein
MSEAPVIFEVGEGGRSYNYTLPPRYNDTVFFRYHDGRPYDGMLYVMPDDFRAPARSGDRVEWHQHLEWTDEPGFEPGWYTALDLRNRGRKDVHIVIRAT